MTNPQGPGTVNIGVNVPAEERAILGRLALETDRSIGAVIRDLLITGLRQTRPDVADQVQQVRHSRRAGLLAIAVILAAATWFSIQTLSTTTQPVICTTCDE